jgi:hypothetical protein
MRAGASDIYETYIENHFKILDEISLFSKKNEVLSERLKEMVAKYRKQFEFFSFGETQTQEDIDSMNLLKRMMSQYMKQYGKNKRERRYEDSVLSDLSINSWILGGHHAFRILHDNLPGIFALPSVVQGKFAQYNITCMPGMS